MHKPIKYVEKAVTIAAKGAWAVFEPSPVRCWRSTPTGQQIWRYQRKAEGGQSLRDQPCQPRRGHPRQPRLLRHAGRRAGGARRAHGRSALGSAGGRHDAGLQHYVGPRWWSRTRSSPESPAASSASAVSSTPTTRPPANGSGASIRFPAPANSATIRGRATAGNTAAAPPGSPAATMPNRIRCTGPWATPDRT